MRVLYNILLLLGLGLSAPYYLLKMWRRGAWRAGFEQRFGKFGPRTKQALTNRHVVWIHAVSVGEVNVCTQLIKALEPGIPNTKLVVSTTTSTGMAELQRKLPTHIEKIYYPIDRRRWVHRAVSLINPEAVVLVEAEIWPNFIWRLRDRRIPLFLVNARLSERSYRGYRRWGFLFRPLFASFTGVGAQNAEDARRLVELGCRPEAIHVVGSLKFDAARLEERRELDVPAMLAQLGVPEGARILLGGSTHAGEEAVLAAAFLQLRKLCPDLFLIVVPRHQERGRQAGQELARHGLRFVYRSEITAATRHPGGDIDALVVNTTGELRFFYACATVVFVGKSLTAEGGQNPIEPGALGKAMVFGPNMQNFAAIASAFVNAGGAAQVTDAATLEKEIALLLEDSTRREQMGRAAREIVRQNQGAIERTVEIILQHLEGGDLYVVPRA